MSQYEIIMNACFSEDGSMCSIVVQGTTSAPLHYKEIADALREYANIIENREETKN